MLNYSFKGEWATCAILPVGNLPGYTIGYKKDSEKTYNNYFTEIY